MDSQTTPSLSLPPSASSRFFSITELALTVISLLERGTIAHLCQVNRRMSSICTPLLYSTQDFFMATSVNTIRILDSLESMSAFARNIHHVHTVVSGPLFVAFYYNCLRLAHQELGVELGSSIDLAAVDSEPRTKTMVPVGPMVNLTTFTYHAYYPSRFLKHHAFIYSSRYPRISQARLLWTLQQFSRLTTLTMNLLVNDEHDILFLVKSLPELRSLKKLDLTITMELNDDWPQFIHAIVFGLPASIECLDIGLEDFDEFGYDQIGCLCPDEDDEDSSTEDATEDVNNRRLRNWKRFLNSQDQPPLEHLRSIHITSLTQVPFDDIAAIFARCPALVELHIPDLDQDLDIVSRVARCIGESCPMITRVYQHGRLNDDRGLTLAITNAVQEQQFELLRFSGLSGSDDLVEAALRRHSTVLRELRLTHCVRLLSKSIQKILSTGHVLEVFQIEPYRDAYCCLTLQDAISVEWVCKGMKQLRLSLSIGATVPPAEDVYYKRPGLIVFTTEEVERFSKLEALYRRIGSLMELEHLDLRAVAECSHPEDRNRYSSYDVSFDAMLSLGDESKGWPGYLHLFSRLKKLKSLNGSVRAKTDETWVTVGQKELEWVDANWPKLEEVDFYSYRVRDDELGVDTRSCWRWLQERRPKLNIKGASQHM